MKSELFLIDEFTSDFKWQCFTRFSVEKIKYFTYSWLLTWTRHQIAAYIQFTTFYSLLIDEPNIKLTLIQSFSFSLLEFNFSLAKFLPFDFQTNSKKQNYLSYALIMRLAWTNVKVNAFTILIQYFTLQNLIQCASYS